MLTADMVGDEAAAETWHDALNAVLRGEMPPKEGKPLNAEQRKIFTTWIRESLDAAIARANKENMEAAPRQINNYEYRYTLQDLLGVTVEYDSEFPPDPVTPEGFANDADSLHISGLQLEGYLKAARMAMRDVLVSGPRPEPLTQTFQEPDADLKLTRGAPEASTRAFGRTGFFGVSLDQVPTAGRFTIRVHARPHNIAGEAAPVLGVVYGHGAEQKLVGQTVMNSDNLKVYEFQGLLQYFPDAAVAGPNFRQVIAVKNLLDDGKPKPEYLRPKNKAKRGYPDDPTFPKIEVEKLEFVAYDYASWPPSQHRQILFEATNEGAPEYVREVLRRFLLRAWRRPASDEELNRYAAHFESIYAQLREKDQPRAAGAREPIHLDAAFVAAMRETLAAALSSSKFLLLTNGDREDRQASDYMLASRLSYFLWCSLPDDRLLKLADEGKLQREEVLREEVRRMLLDSRSERFIRQFAFQWLGVDGVDRVAINPNFYPDFEEDLKPEITEETVAFFREILRSKTSSLQLLDADWTMANAALAMHYGLEGPKSQAFERVSLEGTNRPGGLLGHASMHLANSNGEDSHPILRAVWIRSRLLNDPPLPPPPDVPTIDESDPKVSSLTVRERLEQHRQRSACMDCHRGIDPWGMPLEHFDAVGLWRDEIKLAGKKPPAAVIAVDTLPNGREIQGVEQLKAYLLGEKRDAFAGALTAKMFTYARGRSPALADQPTIAQLAKSFIMSEYRLDLLIEEIVVCEAFQQR